jgi:hypothetical protein
MNLSVFILAGIFSGLAWGGHFLLWRLHRPKDDLGALAACMLGLPCVFAGALLLYGGFALATLAAALLLACCLDLAYLFWYPAAQAVSPTMLMTLLVAWRGGEGMTAEELREAIPETVLTADTFENLFAEGFAYLDGEKVHLSARGRRTLKWILLLRRLAGFGEPRG